MNKDELKKKICEIIAPYVSAWGDDERIADALIAAGIGDMSEIRSLADNVMLSVIAHKAEVRSMEQRAKEAEHRAEVAEKALKDRATYCATYCVMEGMDCFSLTSVAIEDRAKELYKSWRRKSEKELAEEGKND